MNPHHNKKKLTVISRTQHFGTHTHPMTPAQPSNPQPTPNESRVPRKRQARLDDNGEPAGVPVAKKLKSASQNGQKKTLPAKTRPDTQKKKPKAVAPAKKKPSVRIEASANDSDDTRETDERTNLPDPMLVESSNEADSSDIEVIEPPEEDDEAELGMHLL